MYDNVRKPANLNAWLPKPANLNARLPAAAPIKPPADPSGNMAVLQRLLAQFAGVGGPKAPGAPPGPQGQLADQAQGLASAQGPAKQPPSDWQRVLDALMKHWVNSGPGGRAK